ncbi:unnamed protein product [Brassicogethes aeneus]|uniref:Zinc finger CCCH domain-containing protein 3 n=1 Tax=Brassicogethes aeneus TaxID=1431903 RepID=A0A9P0AST6_BRAAE|nr:unnamed protein product [Brassicogethes aeneus]
MNFNNYNFHHNFDPNYIHHPEGFQINGYYNQYPYDPNTYCPIAMPPVQQNLENHYTQQNYNYSTFPAYNLQGQDYNYTNPVEPTVQQNIPSKVHVNPHFGKTKVFINPNFKKSNETETAQSTKIYFNPEKCGGSNIHINPKMQNSYVNGEILKAISKNSDVKPKVIHVNPKILNSDKKVNTPGRKVISTKNKLVRVHDSNISPNTSVRKRRSSLVSTYKIIKSTVITNYKIRSPLKKINMFKVDNRVLTFKPKAKTNGSFIRNRKKYVYVNKFVSISDIAKTNLLKKVNVVKNNKFINIAGVTYRRSINSLKRADSEKPINKIKNTRYKLVRTTNKIIRNKSPIKHHKVSRKIVTKKNVPSKLKKCNVPCPIYRKYGRCIKKDKGICVFKHNPNQISLCTRFLQGACLNEKCPLSHKVSAEKMPTCKYYLEGSCSRDNCPYLHVRISPKADICRDFLEGYCEKAAECDKRHQLLCPDFEKTGNCPKKRCPYPHGKMVRKYTVRKNIAKKCSEKLKKSNDSEQNPKTNSDNQSTSKEEKSSRYYLGKDKQNSKDKNELVCDPDVNFRSRPKLGTLPSYIPFHEESK